MPISMNRETVVELCLDYPGVRVTVLHFGASPWDHKEGQTYETRAKDVIFKLAEQGHATNTQQFLGRAGKRASHSNLVESVPMFTRAGEPSNQKALVAKLKELFPQYAVTEEIVRFSGQDQPVVCIDISPEEEEEQEDPDGQER